MHNNKNLLIPKKLYLLSSLDIGPKKKGTHNKYEIVNTDLAQFPPN